MLSRYYGWTHQDTGRLTERQAAGYYNRIPEVEKMFACDAKEGKGGGKQQVRDMNEILDEADYLGIPTPPRE